MRTRSENPDIRRAAKTLGISAALVDELAGAVCERIENAVSGAQDRDEECLQLYDQLEGRANPQHVTFWKGQCDLEDPLTREHHLTLLASVTAVWRRSHFFLLESIDPADAEAVARVEAYLNVRARQHGLAEALYDVAYNALVFRFSPMYVGWRTYWRYVAGTGFVDPESGDVIEEPVEGEPVEQVTIRAKVPVVNGPEFRAIDPTDFYLWPPDSVSVEEATCCIERLRMTPEALYETFDEELVTRVLQARDGRVTDMFNALLEDQGLQKDDSADASVQIYRVIGRMPLLVDEDGPGIPDWMREQDYEWIIHVPSRTILSVRPLDYPVRPYVVFNSLRVPGRMLGHSIASLLTPLQREATLNLRFTIDTMNLVAAPAMKVPQQWLHMYGKWMMYPGALVPYVNSPDEIAPLTWDMRGVNAGMALAQHIDARAAQLASAQGISSMLGGKVRKAAEVEATVGLVQMKSDLFFSCLQSGLQRVGEILLALYLEHMGEEGDVAMTEYGPVSVKPSDLRANLKITAYATTEDGTPEARLERTMAAKRVQMEYIAATTQMPPYAWEPLYHAASTALRDIGVRNVQDWLGPRPPRVDPPWVAPQTAPQQTAPALAGLGPGPMTRGTEIGPENVGEEVQ